MAFPAGLAAVSLHIVLALLLLWLPLSNAEPAETPNRLITVDLSVKAKDATPKPAYEPKFRMRAPATPSTIPPPKPVAFVAPRAPESAVKPPSPSRMAASAAQTTLADYIAAVSAQLAAVKRYPMAARLAHRQGVVMLQLTLDRSGRVLQQQISSQMHCMALEQEVAAMVARAAPFPPQPPTVKRVRLTITVPIVFSLSP